MAYIRHRPRMVARSVWDDIERLLTELGWMGSSLLAMLENQPVVLMDAFPEDVGQGVRIPPNSLALDDGRNEPPYAFEMGGMWAQDYAFTFGFLAVNDGIAKALFSDLEDRYMGMTEPGFVSLYNYLEATPSEVVRMEVEEFRWDKAPEAVAPGLEFYVAELELTDYLDGPRIDEPVPGYDSPDVGYDG